MLLTAEDKKDVLMVINNLIPFSCSRGPFYEFMSSITKCFVI